MLGSQQSNDVFVADEEQDCSLLGQDHSRKIRAKPVRVSLVFFAARNQMRPKVDGNKESLIKCFRRETDSTALASFL